jgi:hypothetical protein
MLDLFNDNHDIMLLSLQNLDTPLLQNPNIVLESIPIERTKKDMMKKLIATIGQSTCRAAAFRPGAMLLVIAKMSGIDPSFVDI